MTKVEQAKREAMANYTAGALLLPKELFYIKHTENKEVQNGRIRMY